MRKYIPTSLVLAAISFSPSTEAAVLFADNFSTSAQSDDVNFEYSAGRQSGTVGTLQYRQGNGSLFSPVTGTIANEGANGFKTQIGNSGAPGSLFLAANSFTIGSVSPEYNFNVSPGAGGFLSISFSLDAVTGNNTSGDWGAITVGAGDNAGFGSSGTGARGQGILSTAANFGMLFESDGGFQAFDGGTTVGSGTYTGTPGGMFNFELRITGLTDGNPWDGVNDSLVEVFTNGGASPFYSFTKTGGYLDNFITMEAFGSSGGFSISTFDDLQIATVPEPGAASLILGGAVLFAGLRRRRSEPCQFCGGLVRFTSRRHLFPEPPVPGLFSRGSAFRFFIRSDNAQNGSPPRNVPRGDRVDSLSAFGICLRRSGRICHRASDHQWPDEPAWDSRRRSLVRLGGGFRKPRNPPAGV